MSVYETSITNPKKQLEFYKQLSEQLQQENMQLKLELSGYRQAILEDKEMLGLQQENEKLKKKLDKYESPEDMTLMYMWCTEKVKDENKKLKQKQKEFMKYLEENIDEFNFRAILAKYKEIIGGENENK